MFKIVFDIQGHLHLPVFYPVITFYLDYVVLYHVLIQKRGLFLIIHWLHSPDLITLVFIRDDCNTYTAWYCTAH